MACREVQDILDAPEQRPEAEAWVYGIVTPEVRARAWLTRAIVLAFGRQDAPR